MILFDGVKILYISTHPRSNLGYRHISIYFLIGTPAEIWIVPGGGVFSMPCLQLDESAQR